MSVPLAPELERELEGQPWMFPWNLGEHTPTLLDGDLPAVHETRRDLIERPVREALAKAGPSATALDMACHEGWFSQRLLEWGAERVIGVDVRELNIRRARLLRDHFEIPRERLELICSDVYDLEPQELGRFDVVLCLGLIYHVEDPVGLMRMVRELSRTLCALDSQLTRQNRPLQMADRHTTGLLDASFGAQLEADSETNTLASVPGRLSLVPNRAALELMLRTAGFQQIEFPVPSAWHDLRYVRGDRAVVLGW